MKERTSPSLDEYPIPGLVLNPGQREEPGAALDLKSKGFQGETDAVMIVVHHTGK